MLKIAATYACFNTRTDIHALHLYLLLAVELALLTLVDSKAPCIYCLYVRFSPGMGAAAVQYTSSRRFEQFPCRPRLPFDTRLAPTAVRCTLSPREEKRLLGHDTISVDLVLAPCCLLRSVDWRRREWQRSYHIRRGIPLCFVSERPSRSKPTIAISILVDLSCCALRAGLAHVRACMMLGRDTRALCCTLSALLRSSRPA